MIDFKTLTVHNNSEQDTDNIFANKRSGLSTNSLSKYQNIGQLQWLSIPKTSGATNTTNSKLWTSVFQVRKATATQRQKE